jgi:phosphotransferase system enzyme I (PtsI)
MEDIFRTQLRAILRASDHGNLRLMFPMVSSIEEIRQIREVLAEVRSELKSGGLPSGDDIQIGVMVETPAAVAVAHLLAREVDFLSIGTNDLIQFSLAIDRNNPLVSHLYDPFHPAILRQIRRTVKAGHSEKNWVGLCGELPEDPLFTILLIGIGLDEISTGPFRIPEIKRIIREITFDGARQVVKAAWLGSTAAEVRELARSEALKRFPDLDEILSRRGEA